MLQVYLPCYCCSVAQLCLTLCNSTDCTRTGFPILHCLLEFVQTHVHPTIPSSVVPFSSWLQSFPTSGSLRMSQFFASGDQSIGALASASVISMNIQGWFPLRLTGLISLLSKALSRVFCNTTVWKHWYWTVWAAYSVWKSILCQLFCLQLFSPMVPNF